MQRLMLSCKKATELIDKKIHFGISREEKVKLYFHTAMCSACSNYEKQSYFIDRALKETHSHPDQSNHNHVAQSEDLVERIIQKLDKN